MISMEEKIAIVIPAYKCRFLRQTLDSIVVQTCRSFTVYIGDDASPQNLKEIVSLIPQHYYKLNFLST